MASPMIPTVWRAPTDNDRFIKADWMKNGLDKMGVSCLGFEKTKDNGHEVAFEAHLLMNAPEHDGSIKVDVEYSAISAQGLYVSAHADVKNIEVFLPRFGFAFDLVKGTEKIRYFGYGNGESYVDKCLSTRLGLFSTTVGENFVHYVRPQENGSHKGCRFAQIYDDWGRGISVFADDFSFSASHFTPDQLTETEHDYELVANRETTVIVDYKNSGIGSNSCGPVLAQEHRLSDKSFDFKFRMIARNINEFDPFGI